MKTLLTLTTVTLLLAFSVVSAEAELKAQTTCPIMGGKIDKKAFIDHQGQRIYICCAGCKEPFLKEPEKYYKKIAKQNVLLENIQETCPVMGGKIDKKIYTDYNGRRIYFCCESCKGAFAKEPEKYLKKLPGESSK